MSGRRSTGRRATPSRGRDTPSRATRPREAKGTANPDFDLLGTPPSPEIQVRYQSLLHSARDAILLMDGETISECNPAALALFEARPETLIGRSVRDLCLPSHAAEPAAEPLEGRIARALSGSPQRFECRCRRSGGATFAAEVSLDCFEAGGRPMLWAMVRDITERVRATEALRENEARFRAVFETARDAIFLKDRDLRYTAVNPALEKLWGRPAAQALGSTDHDLFGATLGAETRAADLRVLAGEVVEVERSQEIRGKGIVLHVVKVPLRDASGEVIGLCGIARDITERRLLEEELRHSQKMEAIARLAGGVAHDFNNLLTAINGYSQMLLDGLPADDPTRRDLEQILTAGQRAADLTHRLLAFGRPHAVETRPVDLNEVMEGTARLLKPILGEDVQILLEAGPNLARIEADPGHIEQIILSLAVNARDAMPGGGKLTVGTANAGALPADALAAGLKPGPYVRLFVRDTGHGMERAVRTRALEPFFTTKEVGKGTGLGLSTVYGIVQQYKGHLSIHSELGRGTSVEIYFPRARGRAGAQDAAHPDDAPRGSETILLVEDEPSVLEVAERVLRRQGYAVIPASSPAEAARIARESGAPIDLVLTDVIMPGASGPELVEELRSLCPGVRVLYMSGYADASIAHHGVFEKDVTFLRKPFSPRKLAQRVREALGKKR